MSMEIKDAVEFLEGQYKHMSCYIDSADSLRLYNQTISQVIDLLSELRQYRQIGTVEELSEKQNDSRWIPVEEKLPEISVICCGDCADKSYSENVLVALLWNDGNVTTEIGWYYSDGTWSYDYDKKCKVVAWHPLPPAYEPLEEGRNEVQTPQGGRKEEPAGSFPIGRIDYLGNDGTVRESVEYTSTHKLERDIEEENYFGTPMAVTLYRDADGNTIPHDFIAQLDPPLQGFYTADRPKAGKVHDLNNAKEMIYDETER